jgi:hypothetical protein
MNNEPLLTPKEKAFHELESKYNSEISDNKLTFTRLDNQKLTQEDIDIITSLCEIIQNSNE